MPESSLVHDPQVLRAIAHPVRNRILSELAARGSLRAADIARDLDVPANQASFHLRQLAKYGLVEEDPAAARDKRDRVWKVVHDAGLTIRLDDLEATPEGRAAAGVFRRQAAGWGHVVVDAVYAEHPRDGGVHYSLNETAIRLTQEEATGLAAEVADVVDRWRDRTVREGREARERGQGDDGRRTYLYFGAVLPYPAVPGAPAPEA